MNRERTAGVVERAGRKTVAARTGGTRRSRPSAGPTIDIISNSPLWQAEPNVEEVLRRAIAQAAHAVSTTAGELAIVLTDDSSIRTLNRDWRGKDEATNVLSFPLPEGGADDAPTVLLGDIVIAYEATAREALAEGKPFGHHLTHLAVHGFLHLVGYDHETDKEADAMESLETAVLTRLDIPDPYAVRGATT